MFTASRTSRTSRLIIAAFIVLTAVGAVGRAPAASASSANGLTSQSSWACSASSPGYRSGMWLFSSSVATDGTLTAISASPASAAVYATPVGSTIGGNSNADIQFADDTSGSSITLSATVQWASRTDGGPLEATITDTISFSSTCEPVPEATLTSNCQGSVTVSLSNGNPGSVTDAGGTAVFIITAANGFTTSKISVNMGQPGTETVPAADASSIRVTAAGMADVTGGYVPSPGCVGYTPPPSGTTGSKAPPPGATSPTGSRSALASAAANGTAPVTQPASGTPLATTSAAALLTAQNQSAPPPSDAPNRPAVALSSDSTGLDIGLALALVVLAAIAVSVLVSRRVRRARTLQ